MNGAARPASAIAREDPALGWTSAETVLAETLARIALYDQAAAPGLDRADRSRCGDGGRPPGRRARRRRRGPAPGRRALRGEGQPSTWRAYRPPPPAPPSPICPKRRRPSWRGWRRPGRRDGRQDQPRPVRHRAWSASRAAPMARPAACSTATMSAAARGSGSAVAVEAPACVAFALGTDTAGSGRVPAAFNGLVGLKPTQGPLAQLGLVPACRSLDCITACSPSPTSPTPLWSIPSPPGFDRGRSYSRRDQQVSAAVCRSLRVGVPCACASGMFFGDDGGGCPYARGDRAHRRWPAASWSSIDIGFLSWRPPSCSIPAPGSPSARRRSRTCCNASRAPSIRWSAPWSRPALRRHRRRPSAASRPAERSCAGPRRCGPGSTR